MSDAGGDERQQARHDAATRLSGLPALSALIRRHSVAAVQGLADLVVPPLCLACQRPLGSHDALCAGCWRQVHFIRAPLCDRLGIPLPYDTGGIMVSAAAVADPPDWDRARAVAQFGSVVRDLVHNLKYDDRHEARRLFGRWLVEAGRDLLSDADLLVPVPLHRWRLLARKFNQAALLAREVSRLSGIAWDPTALVRIKATPQQVGLSASARRQSLSGAFSAVRPKVEGRSIVLLDDVVTTGSTAASCARVLRRAGAVRVDVLALAIADDDLGTGQ